MVRVDADKLFNSEKFRKTLDEFNDMNKGQQVVIKHQRELGPCTVANPKRETDIIRLDGSAVDHYVDLTDSKGKWLGGYHEDSLEDL